MAAAPVSRLNETQIPDYFAVFGLPRRFGIDRTALERRFYELSRATHPDRFATAGPDAVRQAMERMSLLNEAYRTLKSPDELREYFAKLIDQENAGGAGDDDPSRRDKPAGAQLPAELAESWFELQDAVMEDPASAPAKLVAFVQELATLSAQKAAELLVIERAIDGEYEAAAKRATEAESVSADVAAGRAMPAHRLAIQTQLNNLAGAIRAQSYLKSMERDVERIKTRIAGTQQ